MTWLRLIWLEVVFVAFVWSVPEPDGASYVPFGVLLSSFLRPASVVKDVSEAVVVGLCDCWLL